MFNINNHVFEYSSEILGILKLKLKEKNSRNSNLILNFKIGN